MTRGLETVLGVDLHVIVNNFYVDESGKMVSYNHESKSLAIKNPIDLTVEDYKIIDSEVDLDSIFKILKDPNYIASTQEVKLEDGSALIIPKSYDRSRDRFGLVDNQGLIQIHQRASNGGFEVAKNSKQVIEFAKELESDIKDTLIFDAFSLALKGKWDLLSEITLDPRITKESIVSHIGSYLSSSRNHPFDVNFLAKISANVPTLNYQVSKFAVEHRSHFLSQIVHGILDTSPNSISFAIQIFAKQPNFLDIDKENSDDKIHAHYVKESLGFITHGLIKVQNLELDQSRSLTSQDLFLSYTNCLSRYSRQILAVDKQEDAALLSGVIYRSFKKLIEDFCSVWARGANKHFIFPLISKTLSSFSHQSAMSLLIHRIMIDALIDSKIDRKSREFTVVILKICASAMDLPNFGEDSIKVLKKLITASSHDVNLVNLIKISLNQKLGANDSDENKIEIFDRFSVKQRMEALSALDLYPDNIDHHLDLPTNQILQAVPSYLTYDEVQSFIRNSRRELNLLPTRLVNPSKQSEIAKKIRATENKYQFTKPDLINLTQSFLDYDRSVSKAIIADHSDNVLYRPGDSLFDFIAAPIEYFFADNPPMLDFLLSEIEDLDVAVQEHGLNPDSSQDTMTLSRLKPRLKDGIQRVSNHVYQVDPDHPYLTFLKGFNQSSEGEMLADTQSFLEDKFEGQYVCNSSAETITVKLSPNSVQYLSNCNIEVIKQGEDLSRPAATMQASGSLKIAFDRNAKIANNSFIRSFKNQDLDIKTAHSIQRFIALNANCEQFDQIFYDFITNPFTANGLASLLTNSSSDYHRIHFSNNEEQIYIPRNKDSGFVFAVTRNKRRVIDSVTLHEGLYKYDVNQDKFHQISESLNPANFKELALVINDVSDLCHSINKNARPLRNAFCELKTTKFNKESQIGEVRSTSKVKFKFRAIGKLKSGKKLYLDENGRLLINSSFTSIKLAPISHPQSHAVQKLAIQDVCDYFDLTFVAQHFDHRKKSFHRYPSTFQVQVRKIGLYKEGKNIINIYQDHSGRRFKSAPNSSRLQEICDINLAQFDGVQSLLDAFKERATIHEIFDLEKPQALIENSDEVNIGKIQQLCAAKTSSQKVQKTTLVREVAAKPCEKSPQKSFHIDRFGVIYTKNKQGKMQKHDLKDLDQDSKKTVLRSLNLSYGNLRLNKIYQLLEKNNSEKKSEANLKPYRAEKAHIFVKNGAKYALFKDEISGDCHLMRFDYEKGVKHSKNGIIYDQELVKLVTLQLERKALFDDLEPATYLINGDDNFKIHQEEIDGLHIRSFKLSDVDKKIEKDSSNDKILAIDSSLRILHKKSQEKSYQIANFDEAKKIMPHFYEGVAKSIVRVEDWKNHYLDKLAQREEILASALNTNIEAIKQVDLHVVSKKEISSSQKSKIPGTSVSRITVDNLHPHIHQEGSNMIH